MNSLKIMNHEKNSKANETKQFGQFFVEDRFQHLELPIPIIQ